MHVEFLTLFMISATLIKPAGGHDGAMGVVKQRMDLMSSLGKTMKSLNAMARGKTDYDGKAVQRAGEHILRQSEQMKDLFPKGSNQMPSVAKPEIWTKPDEFNAMADALGVEAQKLGVVGKSGGRDALKRQFHRIGKACSACHKSFRAKRRKH
jgi:cytochrome c556